MASPRLPLNRWLVGGLAAACLVAGIAVGIFQSIDNMWCGAFIRVGLLMGALWLALPSLQSSQRAGSLSVFTLLGVLAAVLVLVRRPQIFVPLFAGLLLIGYLLKPRPKRRPGRNR